MSGPDIAQVAIVAATAAAHAALFIHTKWANRRQIEQLQRRYGWDVDAPH